MADGIFEVSPAIFGIACYHNIFYIPSICNMYCILFAFVSISVCVEYLNKLYFWLHFIL